MTNVEVTSPRATDTGRRRELVEAAMELMISRGISETTTEAVAAAVGIRKSAIHYHFRTKLELYKAALELVLEGSLAALQNGLDPDQPAETQLRHIIYSDLPATESGLRYAKFWFNLMSLAFQEPELAEIHERHKQAWHDTIRECLLRLQREGKFPPGIDPDAVAVTIRAFGSGLGMNILMADSLDKQRVEPAVQFLITNLLAAR